MVKTEERVPLQKSSGRIGGGDKVTSTNKYPYVVNAKKCGASLIAPNVLLSSGQCSNPGFVILGVADLNI